MDDGEVRVVRLGNIGIGKFIDNDRSFVSRTKFSQLTKHEARPGDLIIAALAEPVGRCAPVPPDLGLAMVKADCVRLRVNSAFSAQYVMHALNSPGGLKRAAKVAHGMGRLRINLGDLRALMVPMAPPDEQRRIVAKLEYMQDRTRRLRDTLDMLAAIQKTGPGVAARHLDRLDAALLSKAFRGELVGQSAGHTTAAPIARQRSEGAKTPRRRSTNSGRTVTVK